MKLTRSQKQEQLKAALLKQKMLANSLAKKLEVNFLAAANKKEFVGYYHSNRVGICPIEVKVRNHELGRYDSLIVERKKIEKLMSAVNRQRNTNAYYIEFTTDNKAIILDLFNTPFEWCIETCNEQTIGKEKKVEKHVAFVSYDLCTIVDMDDKENEPIRLKNTIPLF